MRIEAAVLGRKRAGVAQHDIELDLPGGPVALRELIAAVVRTEVAAFQQRSEEQRFVRVLTQESLKDGLRAGAIRMGGAEEAQHVDVNAAVETAILAYADGIYQVLVNDEPTDNLDQIVDLQPDTHLLFLRLVGLSGG